MWHTKCASWTVELECGVQWTDLKGPNGRNGNGNGRMMNTKMAVCGLIMMPNDVVKPVK